MRISMHIRIRFDVLGTSVGRVVIPWGSAGTALVEDAVPPGSSMMRVVVVRVMMVVDIMPTPIVRFL